MERVPNTRFLVERYQMFGDTSYQVLLRPLQSVAHTREVRSTGVPFNRHISVLLQTCRLRILRVGIKILHASQALGVIISRA